MQTLNVGAGRTDAEYRAAGEQRRTELRADVLFDANCFFWAAGLSALSTGLLPIRFSLGTSVGLIDLLAAYGGALGASLPLVVRGAGLVWVLALAGLGLAAQRGRRWAFLAGLALYGCDMLALVMMFAIPSFGVHSFFVYRWFQGQRRLKDLKEEEMAKG